ncbi:GNAT family N-acetyltransferase [Rhodoplanes sp. SY1]|uniref:GNAT family N-acetyltransferase n=1 Tax=Rhodoplanes sp. SY1 TaxID=3166646 RepID=UPI0038B511EB
MSEPAADLSAPVPVTEAHDLSSFRSGEPVLDEWLRERALANTVVLASKTYVVCDAGTSRVVGYYALCMGQILNRDATGAMRRNMPRHIPAVVLARLAVDRERQGRGLGKGLLQDAIWRSARAAQEISARLVVVHAISPAAELFYRRYGFVRLPVETPTYAFDLVTLSRAR